MANSIGGSGGTPSEFHILHSLDSHFKAITVKRHDRGEYTEFIANVKTNFNGKEYNIEIAFSGKKGEWGPDNISQYIDKNFGASRLEQIFKQYEKFKSVDYDPNLPNITKITANPITTITHERPHALRGPDTPDIVILPRQGQRPSEANDDIKILPQRQQATKAGDDDIKIVPKRQQAAKPDDDIRILPKRPPPVPPKPKT